MAFSSFSFLCIFFPAVFLLYQLIPTSCRTGRAAERTDSMKYRNLFLVFASLLFYSAGEGAHIVLLFLCIAISYAGGLLIGKASEKGLERTKKTVFIVSVAASLGLLAAYKYTGMAIETVNSLFRLSLRSPKQVFPIGISFYTLQSVSYLTDVYRKKSAAEKNAVDLILYLSFFPALLAGPINQYHVISEQISARTADRKTCAEGLERFILGLAKKVLIADTLASGADAVFSMSASSLGMLSAWIGAAAYTLQLYFDFSGYSDMAIGMGSVFGFRFAENFNDPLAAVSIQDF
jgi:alginate O-acetyltransferase complex protein AlgI